MSDALVDDPERAEKNALVKQYRKLFELEDVELTFTDDRAAGDCRARDQAQDRRAGFAFDRRRPAASTRCSICPTWKA